jgi:beta-lactamase regulating signal transducer with metallopeptidase domain
VSIIAMTITPRPSIAEAVSVIWVVLAVVSWLSTIKEVLAIRDRRAIKPEATPC